MQEETTLTLSETIEAGPDAVYYAMTNGAALREWLCSSSQVDTREGGRIYLWWQQGYYASGEFTKLEPEKAIAFSWQGKGEPHESAVSVALEADGAGTTVHLTHSGLGPDEVWADTRQELQKGWQTGLQNLKSVLETGLDRRIYDRPFLGIWLSGPVTAEQAEELGIPVAGGIRISGTVEGAGAAESGLQNDDIITDIAGTATTDFTSLQASLRPHRVGDKVKVTYYREGEKQSALMTLSRRPLPDTPATPREFAEQLRQLYDQLDQELEALLSDVTEEEASYCASAESWNVKEILAHLVTTERLVQAGLAAQLTDGVIDGFPNNPTIWMRSVTAVYQRLPDMVELWQRTEAETVSLIANLPPEFVKRKASYMNAGNTFLQGLPGHTRTHFAQIQAIIEQARAA